MKTRRPTFLIFFCVGLLLCLTTFKMVGQQHLRFRNPLGTNLSAVADWSTEMPFVDAFKTSRTWLTQCVNTDPDCDDPWNTKEYNKLNLDPQGWVKSLPPPDAKEVYTRVGTLLFNGMENYPKGTYIVLYEGEGTIEYGFDAVKNPRASKPGRDVLQVTPSSQGIYLIVTKTDPRKTGKYLRNIRVIPQQYEASYKTKIFNPKFLEKISPFQTLRFMDWMKTNNSPQQYWQDRPLPNKASYADSLGVPLEVLIKLTNQLNVNPWFNIPHQADDEYVNKFAQLVKKTLKPNLTIYLEYSNEVWNPQFQQFSWVRDKGFVKNQNSPYQSYGIRTAQICQVWKQVFDQRKDRVQCVMATQTANPWVAEQVLKCPAWQQSPCYKHGIDLLAITGYFSGELGKPKNADIVRGWLSDVHNNPFDLAIKQLNNGEIFPTKDSVEDTIKHFQNYTKVATEYGLKLVVYEGGSHVVGVQGIENDPELTEFFIDLHRQAAFYDLYQKLLQGWQDNSGQRTLFMHYGDISRPSKWGSWGALEHLEQESSPRYQALLDFIQGKNE